MGRFDGGRRTGKTENDVDEPTDSASNTDLSLLCRWELAVEWFVTAITATTTKTII